MSDEINDKLDKLDARLDEMDKTLVSQHESLKHHMYRTEIAEKRLELSILLERNHRGSRRR